MRKLDFQAVSLAGTVALLGLMLQPTSVQGCGMMVHMDVTERALNSWRSSDPSYPYDKILRQYHSYVQAGSPFPDWGYLCGTPAGEDSHWPPFVEAYKAYLEKTYTKGSERYNQLIAFLFGVESHIEADVLWHWGRKTDNTQSQGFLQSMSHDGSDCNDDWNNPNQSPNCHTDGDNGADFYDGGRGGTLWVNETWSIPTGDLEQIYKTMNLPDESSEKIAECTLVMYIGSILTHYYANLITFHFDTHAAFLSEELDLWYHGGLEDMGTQVAWKWAQLSRIFARSGEPASQNLTQAYSNPGCSVFGTGFLRGKAPYYSTLMGVSVERTDFGHHVFHFNKTELMQNSGIIIEQLFADLGLER
jgi:hypothetical protein